MQLIDNWLEVAKKAWSSRLAWLSAILSTLEVVLPYFTGLVPPGTFAILAVAVSAAAAIARLVAQPETLPAAATPAANG
jgi:hypothetical protein